MSVRISWGFFIQIISVNENAVFIRRIDFLFQACALACVIASMAAADKRACGLWVRD